MTISLSQQSGTTEKLDDETERLIEALWSRPYAPNSSGDWRGAFDRDANALRDRIRELMRQEFELGSSLEPLQ